MAEMRCAAVLLALACMGACDTSSSQSDSPSGAVVESAAPRWNSENAWRLDAKPEVTIGDANGTAAEYALDGVVGAARLSDGRIVIANFNSLDLRYFDAKGQHVRTTGRKGNGPGEFRLIRGMGRAGDSIVVWDPYANRVSRFDPTGNFASSTSLDRRGIRVPTLIGSLDDGSILLRVESNEDDSDREGEYADSVTYLRFSTRTGKRMSAFGPYFGVELFAAKVNHNRMSKSVIFGRRSLVAGAHAGFYRGMSDRFEATFYTPDGRAMRTARRQHEPVRATAAAVAAERKKFAASGEEILRWDPDLALVRRRLGETVPHRSTLPAITRLLLDRQDNLWIQAYVPPDADAAEWSVFDPEGHWLGVVEIPTAMEVMEIGDNYVLAKTVDPADDVERVVLYRLHKPR